MGSGLSGGQVTFRTMRGTQLSLSQAGKSIGNNVNNRTEAAVGSANEIWTAYREERFGKSPRRFSVICSSDFVLPSEVRDNGPHRRGVALIPQTDVSYVELVPQFRSPCVYRS